MREEAGVMPKEFPEWMKLLGKVGVETKLEKLMVKNCWIRMIRCRFWMMKHHSRGLEVLAP